MPLPPLTIFDVETTGLEPHRGHRIVEIAGVRVEAGTILWERTFASFVNPEREIPWEARQVNKIRDEDVNGAPTIDVVLPQFLDFAKNSVLVAHNAPFDMSFLAAEKEFCWGYVDLPEALCTLQLARALFPGDFRHNLDALSQKFFLTLPSPQRHRALGDSLLTAQALLKMLATGRVDSIEKLRKLASLKPLIGRT